MVENSLQKKQAFCANFEFRSMIHVYASFQRIFPSCWLLNNFVCFHCLKLKDTYHNVVLKEGKISVVGLTEKTFLKVLFVEIFSS